MNFWRNLFNSNHKAGCQWAEHVKLIAASDTFSKPEDVPLPAFLLELKETYENTMATRYQDFYLRKAMKMHAKLDVLCVKGIENLQLMRSNLYHYLSVITLMHKWGWLLWLFFTVALFGLSFLDFAPTTLVFNTLMEDEAIQGMICKGEFKINDFGISACEGGYYLERSTMIFLAIAAFLFGVVMLGHILAKVFIGEYFDHNISKLGVTILVVVAAVFLMLSGLRYFHEEKVAQQNYEISVNKTREAVMLTDSPEVKAKLQSMESESGKAAILGESYWKNIFSSSLFSIMSMMIMLIAIYLSVWHEHGSVRYLIQQRKSIISKIEIERTRTQLENASNEYNALVMQLRQSAQREVSEFFIGLEEKLKSDMSQADLVACYAFIRKIRKAFNISFDLPEMLKDTARVRLPNSEIEWGANYRSFIENALFYDAFEKGAQDAINLGAQNINTLTPAFTISLENDEIWSQDHPKITKENLQQLYESGYFEGSKVKHGKAWKKNELENGKAPDGTNKSPANN